MELPQLAATGWRPLFTPHHLRPPRQRPLRRARARRPLARLRHHGATPDVNPQAERWFCHGSGPSLAAGEFRERGRVCDFGRRAWAPTVAFDGEQWVMLYGPDLLHAAISDDPRLDHWQEVPCSVTGAPVGAVMRDGMILRLDDDTWLLYSTGKRGHEGAISVCVSENLLDWRFVRFALRTTPEAPKQPPWGATESPFVFRHGDDYWLSITYTSSMDGPAGYHETLLFKSNNPFDFGTYTGVTSEVAARLEAHAPEYLLDPDTDQWYITSAGWPGDMFGTEIPGSVAIRELDWVATP